jgi:tRNA nucleotidyltransferase (CCA-adding enzyme)
MPNYMIMLENHLTLAQNSALAQVQEVAAEQGLNLFVTGSGIRDMIAGSSVQDLEFVIEGSALKLARAVEAKGGAKVTHSDDALKLATLAFENGARATVAMARQERYPKPGVKPQIMPATIHEHLRSRDFTINAIAISLTRASRGLLIDPNNGVSDLQMRELRAIGNYAFYDQPIRLLQLFRLKSRLGFNVAEKTWAQYKNAREAEMEKHVRPEALLRELRKVAREANPLDILQAWESEGLLARVAPLISGAKLNAAGFAKLQKAQQVIPFRAEVAMDDFALFFHVLTEKLPPRERNEFTQTLGMDKETIDSWHKLEARSSKLEKDLTAASVTKPSHIYRVLSKAPVEQLMFLLMKSTHRSTQDRIRNYFSKYLPMAQEVNDAEVEGVTPGTPKFEKAKADLIARRLDARPKKPIVDAEAVPAGADAVQ